MCPLVILFIAKEAFEKGANPIIIDNTNMQAWEMRPYVAQVSMEYTNGSHVVSLSALRVVALES